MDFPRQKHHMNSIFNEKFPIRFQQPPTASQSASPQLSTPPISIPAATSTRVSLFPVADHQQFVRRLFWCHEVGLP
jgi:hypothetical protein